MLMLGTIIEKLLLLLVALTYVMVGMIIQIMLYLGHFKHIIRMTIITQHIRVLRLVVQENLGMICTVKLMAQLHMMFWSTLRNVG
ncbi:hypothetical protein V6Z11_D11G096000 [Gossypium hirsutum]